MAGLELRHVEQSPAEDGTERVLLHTSAGTITCRFHDAPAGDTAVLWVFGAGGGLGVAVSAAVGAQIGAPDRPVVAVLGEGSAQYTITALWTAVAYKVPLTILVLRNDEYAILKWFSDLEQVTGVPGLDLPGLDCVAIARAYGMEAARVEDRDSLRDALADGIGASEPRLVEVPIARGMSA